MKVATWNVARPAKRSADLRAAILDVVGRIDADLWILTETHGSLSPGPLYSPAASERVPGLHDEGESWVAMWSRTGIGMRAQPTDPSRTAAATVRLSDGTPVLVIGTVLPYLGEPLPDGGRADAEGFCRAIDAHAADWAALRERFIDHEVCLGGDFNQDLSLRHYYGSRRGRACLERVLSTLDLQCVTGGKADPVRALTNGEHAAVDHICLSPGLANRVRAVQAWERTRRDGHRLSDHFGVVVHLTDS
jgi:hypothetical protein